MSDETVWSISTKLMMNSNGDDVGHGFSILLCQPTFDWVE